MNPTTLLVVAIFSYNVRSELVQSCDSLVYCQGELLDTIQRAKIFTDSKTFVDMIQINPANQTLGNFYALMSNTNNTPTDDELNQFVEVNFVSEGELDEWTPSDYTSTPAFLKTIDDIVVRDFARILVSIWPDLARKTKSEVSEKPDQHSLIPLPNGFIIPGGRFKEAYYWDSYWIVKGLLLSEMQDTVKGMLENFLYLVKSYGFVPNGSRVYYLNRSQPPLLSLMAGLYIDASNNLEWLRENIAVLEEELKWWLNNRVVDVEKYGVTYTLAHFASKSGTPRPESYYEDINTCGPFENATDKESCYRNLKSGAESGWDFSTRWIFDPSGGTNANLTHVQATRVAPVDLNSFLCKAFQELSRLYQLLGDADKSNQWQEKASTWRKSIELVLYDKEDGIWYDYDITLSKSRKLFFPSNFAPLWSECYNTSASAEYGSKAAEYFTSQGINEYNGGIPTSLDESGEQWDLPNAWPPLQEIVILGLKNTGSAIATAISDTFARRWIDANIRGYNENHEMFEKYDALNSGKYGGGGEYTVQSGFGWTNGVALSLINQFYVNSSKKYKRSKR